MNGLDVIGGTVRSDLGSSLRLALREERWFVVDLLGGVAGYAIWVAGTAALGLQVATLAEYQVAPAGGAPTVPVLTVVALLWIVLPAIAGAAHLRARILNIRGNIDGVYRVDRPGMLLAAPVAFLLVLSVGALVASGPIAPILAAALVPATVYFLVRTAAFSYRVYAFSRPVAVHAATVLTLAVHASVGLAYLALANGQRALIEGATETLGLGMVFSDVDLVITTAPYLITMAVFVPVALGSAYLVLQRAAVFVARQQDRPISAGSLRTGQRYPPWWEGEPAGLTTSRRSKRGATDGAGAGATNGGVSAGTEAAGSDGGAGVGDSDSRSDGSPPGETITQSTESTVESASHTRVYTPPKEELEDMPDPVRGGSVRDDDAGGATDGDVSDEETHVMDEKAETCWSCGATLPQDSNASYCPQCGEQIV